LHARRLVVGSLAAAAAAAALALPQIVAPDGARSVAFSNAAGMLRVDGGTARLSSWSMGAAPAGHSYELWVMRPGDPPRAAGFVGDGRGVVIDGVRNGDQIGVTVEAAAGSPAPTTPPIAVARIA
jgi:anti-sigma-K factor RskA